MTPESGERGSVAQGSPGPGRPLPVLGLDEEVVVPRAAAVVGHRIWQVRGPDDALRLAGIHPLCPATWTTGDVRAECLARPILARAAKPGAQGCVSAPGLRCATRRDTHGGCGLWADHLPTLGGDLRGTVLVWGRLVGTLTGVRAEHARIVDLEVADRVEGAHRSFVEDLRRTVERCR